MNFWVLQLDCNLVNMGLQEAEASKPYSLTIYYAN